VLNAEVILNFSIQNSAFSIQPYFSIQHSEIRIQKMDGVLVIDKPAGPTSHDVVAVVRRALGGARVGHTGTLDPLATGVLPLVIGRATRLASFMTGADKEYVARIRFGLATNTYDAEGLTGREERASVAGLTEAAVREGLNAFVGRYLQTPPPFSAKKVGGTAAYKLARRNEPVAVKPVEVVARGIELTAFVDGVAEVRLVSSSGYYVRSLAHDVGVRLGYGAYLESLRRTRSAGFTLDRAVSLDTIVTGGVAAAERALVPLAGLLSHLPAVVLTPAAVKKVSHGADVVPSELVGRSPSTAPLGKDSSQSDYLRLFDGEGRLLALAEPGAGGTLHPVLVLM
jgi:tRNA pseudouridine55 synthase